jgi:hypothetical protein
VLIDRLRSEIELQPGEALVLVAETPGVVWGEHGGAEPSEEPVTSPATSPPPAPADGMAEASSERAAPQANSSPNAVPVVPPDAFGPALPAIPDVGRAMLGGVTPTGRPARTVLILIPLVRDRLELLPTPG